MKIKKFLGLILALALVMSISGCSNSKPSPSGTSSAALKSVTLKMVLLGDTPQDSPKVYDTLNAQLKKDINATVSVQFLAWADWSTKYPLILASGQDYDIIVSANWSDYFKNAKNGAFLELTNDMLKKYAPQTFKDTPKEVFDSALVDGKLYDLPMNYKEITIDGYIVRGDLMKKYNVPDIKTLSDFGNYLAAIKKNCPDMIPWDTSSANVYLARSAFLIQNGYRDLTKGGGDIGPAVAKLQNSPKVVSLTDVPGLEDYFNTMHDWNLKGYWSKNALVNKTPEKDSFVNGKSGAFVDNLLDASATYTALKTAHPDWELSFYPMSSAPLVANPYINNGVSINAKSQNPERALMLIDLLRNNKWYNQLTTYGIEGTHWKLADDGKLISLDASKNFAPDSACPWGWRNTKFYLMPENSFSDYATVLKNAQDTAVNTNIANFSPDKTVGNITSEEAAFDNIKAQYLNPLLLGFSKDVHGDFEKLIQQYKNAGIDDYVSQYQKQIDSFGVKVQ
jgi:putative aldouronate transport system substrate-binding protein